MRDAVVDCRTLLNNSQFYGRAADHQFNGYLLELTCKDSPSRHKVLLSTEFLWAADLDSVRPAFEAANDKSDEKNRKELTRVYDLARTFDQQNPQNPAIVFEMKTCNDRLTDRLDTPFFVKTLRKLIPA